MNKTGVLKLLSSH